MILKRTKTLLSTASAVLAVSAVAVLVTPGSVAQSAALPVISYDVAAIAPADSKPAVVQAQPAALTSDAPQVADQIDAAALECMAKVVHHEARNQPRRGQIAVAQTLVNRMKAGGRFGETVCEVASQRGQFFDITAYRPNHDSDTWANAVDVSRAVLRGEEDAGGAAPGAVYFRAAYRPASTFFRSRQRVGAIGDHIFYR